MRNNRLFKKGLAMVMSGFLALTAVPVSGLVADPIVSVAATKNTVKAKKTVIAPSKANTIAVTKAKKGYKMTVKVLGTGKKFVTVKYGKTVLVKNGTTQKKGKKKVVAKKTKFNLTATATKKALKKNYKVQLVFTKGTKKVTTKPVTVKVAVTKVKLNKTSASLKVGGTVTLKATVNPSNATYKTVSWKTSNSKVATVSKGKVTAKGAGTATITATADGKKATCKVTVTKADVAVTGVTLDKESADLTVGETLKLNAKVEPDNATDKTVNWTTTDANIASVAKDGTVTAVAAGEATIKAKAGDKEATCKVTVKEAPVEVTDVSLDKEKLELKVGETAVLKATVKPDNATDKTVKWESSDEKVAKVEETADGAKVTAVTGGSATITATAGKISAECTVSVATGEIKITGVALDNTTPKVDQTINAILDPKNADNVAYQWFMGDSSAAINEEIKGETGASLKVTKDMIGKYLQVVVTGAGGSTAFAATSVAVRDADSTKIEIVKAEQTGAKTIKATFSNPVTSSDNLTVKKGSNEVKIDGAIDYATDFSTATITLADKITASEYTVTLTPADTKVKATEVTFTGAISELKEIKFLNNYLVMADNDYKKGYAYVKGYDQFGGEVSLSGLTVNAGLGDMTSYDSTTGKITLEIPAGTDNTYMLIKEVPCFVQYQQGNQVLTASQTLTVSTRSFVNNIEFGDIKKDGTMRSDKRLTMTELRSGKYYVELNKVEDQYGNTLDADELNKQKSRTENVLFVIPSTSGAYYTTGDFGTLDGKTILWLSGDANSKPGTMALTITGAGGKSFTKDITIEDDPYIDTLHVSYPEIYAAQSETNALEFSAVDQYGQAMDLWDVRPHVDPTAPHVLVFGDANHMTNMQTEIKVSGNTVFRNVTTDSAKKTFTVTLDASASEAKEMAVFTVTTAGMKVSTASITIGEQGSATKIKTSLKSGAVTQLADPAVGEDSSLNFNKYVQFEDANGNTMVRGKSDLYPTYEAIDGYKVSTDTSNIKNSDYKAFIWSVTTAKVNAKTDTAYGAGTADANGVVTYEDVREGAVNGDGSLAGTQTKQDFVVTVYGWTTGAGTTPAAGDTVFKLDEKTFHLTRITGFDKSFSATPDGIIYAADLPGGTVGQQDDTAEIKVTATTTNGETYAVKKDRIVVADNGKFKGGGSALLGWTNGADPYNDNTSGEVETTVFVKKYIAEDASASYAPTIETKAEEVENVKIPYSNIKSVATTIKYKYNTTSPANGTFNADEERVELTVTGGGIFASSLDDKESDNAVADGTANTATGVLLITKVGSTEDTLEMFIEDQYGMTMTDTTFTIDGAAIAPSGTSGVYETIPSVPGRYTFIMSNGSLSKKFYITK